jgi:hypothetical protein
MKKKLKALLAITLSAFITLTATMPVLAAPSDISGHWGERIISRWVDSGWIKGYPDGSFRPDNPLIKADFAALVNRSLNFTKIADIIASDVTSENWFFNDIAKAVAAGYIHNPDGGEVKPYDKVTREDMAVMIARMLKLKLGNTQDALGAFTDADDIDENKRAEVNAVVAAGIMQGDGNKFMPLGYTTRAEGIVILERILSMLENGALFSLVNLFWKFAWR